VKKVAKTAKKMAVGKKGQRGFTLIELLIVIGILAIVAAVAIPNLTKFMGKGKKESWSSDRNTIQTAVLAYRSDNLNSWPVEGAPDTTHILFSTLVSGGYLTETPASSDQATTPGSYAWAINSDGQVTTTYVSGTYP
jgi:prepilin-type N-terminal cleavage/methylation domain-containing protein